MGVWGLSNKGLQRRGRPAWAVAAWHDSGVRARCRVVGMLHLFKNLVSKMEFLLTSNPVVDIPTSSHRPNVGHIFPVLICGQPQQCRQSRV